MFRHSVGILLLMTASRRIAELQLTASAQGDLDEGMIV